MKKITSEYAHKIMEELGAVGIILIATDSQIPCPDSRAGIKCEHHHDVSAFVSGMSLSGALDVVERVLENLANQNG